MLQDGEQPGYKDESQSHVTNGEGLINDALPERDFTVREAMLTPTYWWIVFPVGLSGAVHSGTRFLLAPVLIWFLSQGYRSDESNLLIASLFVTVLAFSTIASSPTIGWIGDKVSKQKLSSVCMLCGATSLLILISQNGNLWLLTAFCGLMALAAVSYTHLRAHET